MYSIAIFQDDIGVGGIQKSIVNLLRNLDYSKYKVDLFLFKDEKFWDIAFPEQLNIYYLKPLPEVCKYIPFDIVRKFFKLDFGEADGKKYDIAIDFNSYQPSCALGALRVAARKRVMWIHNNVEIKYENEWKYRVLWNAFKGKFKYFDGFVPCSEALEIPFRHLSGMKDKDFTVIHNFIDSDEIRKKADELPYGFETDDNFLNFVALGKLCRQKGYDIMLDTFAEVFQIRNDIRLYILGDGPDKEEMQERIDREKWNDRVFLLGNKDNPYCYMKKMDAFVSTSRYEGQPLNIMEARVIGLPLYCSKNLEAYSKGLAGYEHLAEAIIRAEKQVKAPDLLLDYNYEIVSQIEKLVASS